MKAIWTLILCALLVGCSTTVTPASEQQPPSSEELERINAQYMDKHEECTKRAAESMLILAKNISEANNTEEIIEECTLAMKNYEEFLSENAENFGPDFEREQGHELINATLEFYDTLQDRIDLMRETA